MKSPNFIRFSLIWVLFIFKLGFGVQLGQQAIAEHRKRLLTLSNKVFENYGDMPFYPGYRPIKSRFRFILPRFKEIRSEIRENSTFYGKNNSILVVLEKKNNENMLFSEKNDSFSLEKKNDGLAQKNNKNIALNLVSNKMSIFNIDVTQLSTIQLFVNIFD